MEALCRNLQVSTSGYYSWMRRKTSDRERVNSDLRKRMTAIFDLSRGTYGRRRLTAAVNRDLNKGVSINRVERRMKELKIAGYRPPSFKRTTIGDPLLEDSPNLIKAVQAKGIDHIWVSDITYISTSEGWLYLCVIIDLFSRKVVGWKTSPNMKADVVIDSLKDALKVRRPKGKTIFHSDKGGQYKSKRFRRMLKRNKILQSMTGVDHCYDNAFAESFFGTLKSDLVRGKTFANRDVADAALFEYIEIIYNRFRLHSSLGYQSPEEFEKKIA